MYIEHGPGTGQPIPPQWRKHFLRRAIYIYLRQRGIKCIQWSHCTNFGVSGGSSERLVVAAHKAMVSIITGSCHQPQYSHAPHGWPNWNRVTELSLLYPIATLMLNHIEISTTKNPAEAINNFYELPSNKSTIPYIHVASGIPKKST